MTDQTIVKLADQTGVMAENGPMGIVIQAWDRGKPDLEMALQAARFSFTCLAQVAEHHAILRDHPCILPKGMAPIPRAMVESVMAIGEKDLTPMAAVAGSIADAVADWLFSRGMSRVIVNNGGDIAIRLAKSETARVGIRTRVENSSISHGVELTGIYPSWGVTTSGLGGRSLTRGIASAVTAFARTASLADAAATSIANACFVKDDAIVQVLAQNLDPYTDIRGIPVTVKVGKLKKTSILQAMNKALSRAEQLFETGIILGAVIAVENELSITPEFDTRIGILQSVGPQTRDC
jgi:ApbE superfamily uncharacterized protein (UPF0280 family)